MDLLTRVSAVRDDGAADAPIDAASACLDRFTDRFNARDVVGMDAELHFPHVLLSGGQAVVWPTPGQHPADFFEALMRSGWARTRYNAKTPVLATHDTVHVVVDYSRLGADGAVVSAHRNLWIIARVDGRWGICLRSY